MTAHGWAYLFNYLVGVWLLACLGGIIYFAIDVFRRNRWR